ncbi:MAG: quinoprotein relay system zinc metallohydrolase 1 [Burkholderiales bacterium]|nr:quinoprotein relay system zinc metallohydrolase 1 [Burkholderiales bacterium]
MPTVNIATRDYGLKVSALPGGWQLVAGANDDFSIANGCNIINTGFLPYEGGVLVINTGVSLQYGEQQRRLIESKSGRPVRQVLALNLHPDYFFGHQAYADTVRLATAETMAGATREGGAYADNLYRLCGDWMKGTESTPPALQLSPGMLTVGERTLELIELSGHTDSDLVVFDRQNGVMWAGGLVFNDRVPTMPHARLAPWLESLERLKSYPVKVLVPSHGPISDGSKAIDQTLDYLRWLDGLFTSAANQGLEINQVMRLPIPERFSKMAAMPAEYHRTVATLYPAYETAAFGR